MQTLEVTFVHYGVCKDVVPLLGRSIDVWTGDEPIAAKSLISVTEHDPA